MPYVQRDDDGAIVAISIQASDTCSEWVDAETPEFAAFLAQWPPPAEDDLARSDQSLIRVVEDVIDTLIEKNVIRFTDLPEAAQHKLAHRRSLRRSQAALESFGDDDQQSPAVIKL
jgi:hypothetical protein